VNSSRAQLKWLVPVEQLDVLRYLPVFFDGLAEFEEPMQIVALQGTVELLQVCSIDQILQALPLLIMPIRSMWLERVFVCAND